MDVELERNVQARLVAKEHRYTRSRRAIVVALAAAEHPVTLPELLAAGGGALAQSSTYRNLALMEESGVVRRLVHGGDHAHYELAEELTEHHHHLICEGCGDVRDVTFDAALERSLHRRFEGLAQREGFVARHHSIDVYGTCPSCAA